MQHTANRGRVPYVMSVASTAKNPARMARMARLGRWALRFFPAKVESYLRGDLPDVLTRLDKLLLAGLISKYRDAGTIEELAILFDAFWQADSATDYHHRVENRFKSIFLPHHASRLTAGITDATGAAGHRYLTLCEIGCGSGQVLDWLQRELPGLQRAIGLDFSAAQTAANRQRWSGGEVRFESGDAAEWIPANATPGWIYVTYGGVFEYFTQRKLTEFLKRLSQYHAPCMLALVEPLADDHDLEAELRSRPCGHETTFSHNYPRLLADCGWVVTSRWDQQVDRQRWLTLVATAGPAAPFVTPP